MLPRACLLGRVALVLALGGSPRLEFAMAAEFVPQAQDELVPPNAQVEVVWAQGEFTEGPAASPFDHCIYFSDIGNSILRFHPGTGEVDLFRQPSGKANGLMFDGNNRLYACEGANGGNRRVTVTNYKGQMRTLVDAYQGRAFNSPNDLFVDSRHRVWFTDPRYVGDEPRELDFEGVFVVEPTGEVRLATAAVSKPNGILVSPDLKRLYVADSSGDPHGNHQLLEFPIRDDGSLGDKRVLFDFGPDRRGIDGMTLDVDGNIYAAAGRGEHSGIYIFDSQGAPLAKIPLPGPPTNCEFGMGDQVRTLYITGALGPGHPESGPGSHGLLRVRVAKSAYRGFRLPIQ
jgi:gluconolactonase